MNTLFSNALVDKIIKAVRDLADAVTPRPAPVPVPIPVRNVEPPVRRRYPCGGVGKSDRVFRGSLSWEPFFVAGWTGGAHAPMGAGGRRGRPRAGRENGGGGGGRGDRPF